MQIYNQLLLSAYEATWPFSQAICSCFEVEGAKLTDLSVTLEGPAGGISMQEPSPNGDGDDFEAVAFGVQADFAERTETPSALEASDDEDEKGVASSCTFGALQVKRRKP